MNVINLKREEKRKEAIAKARGEKSTKIEEVPVSEI